MVFIPMHLCLLGINLLDDQVDFIISAAEGNLRVAIQQLIDCSQVPFEIVELFTVGLYSSLLFFFFYFATFR